jgi:hypothetical protein
LRTAGEATHARPDGKSFAMCRVAGEGLHLRRHTPTDLQSEHSAPLTLQFCAWWRNFRPHSAQTVAVSTIADEAGQHLGGGGAQLEDARADSIAYASDTLSCACPRG